MKKSPAPSAPTPIPLEGVNTKTFPALLNRLTAPHKKWAETLNFQGKSRELCFLPSQKGTIDKVIFGFHSHDAPMWDYAWLATQLPPHTYALPSLPRDDAFWACFAWQLAAYKFAKYRSASKEGVSEQPQLRIPSFVDTPFLDALISATSLIRDLINEPANHMGPEGLEQEAKKVAKAHKAKFSSVVGDKLLKENFPLVHAVGKGAAEAPRFVHLVWGDKSHPRLCLVGKGITFDTGGLNIKPFSGMQLMKKDMAGAAHALGFAQLLMTLNCPLHLHVILPIAENSIGSRAMRTSDIYPSRGGKSVEIGHTDCEGRLVLADGLTFATEQNPNLIIDFSTLTGAAQVALGQELPAFFTNKPSFVSALRKSADTMFDPMWQLPLWPSYKTKLKSAVADLDNKPSDSFGGAISAALFLEAFVENYPWIHIDMRAWNNISKPGRPQGGEAMTIRALYDFIQKQLLKEAS